MPTVWSNQYCDTPVSTRPLSGISSGSTTSNTDTRSLATMSSRSCPTSYTSRTLPEYTCGRPVALSIAALPVMVRQGRRLDPVELVEGAADVGERTLEVEARVEPRVVEHRTNIGGGQQ